MFFGVGPSAALLLPSALVLSALLYTPFEEVQPSSYEVDPLASNATTKCFDETCGPKVLVVGLSRTGTSSVKAALSGLGHNAYHTDEVIERQFPFWYYFLTGRLLSPDLVSLYRGTGVDSVLICWQAALFDELIAAFPKAKVILTVRDEEPWLMDQRNYVSGSTLYHVRKQWWRLVLCYASRAFRMGHLLRWLGVLDRSKAHSGYDLEHLPELMTIWKRVDEVIYGSRGDAGASTIWRAHRKRFNSHVRSSVLAEQLMEFDASKHGWPELTHFLGVPPRSDPFPREFTSSHVESFGVGSFDLLQSKTFLHEVVTAAALLVTMALVGVLCWREHVYNLKHAPATVDTDAESEAASSESESVTRAPTLSGIDDRDGNASKRDDSFSDSMTRADTMEMMRSDLASRDADADSLPLRDWSPPGGSRSAAGESTDSPTAKEIRERNSETVSDKSRRRYSLALKNMRLAASKRLALKTCAEEGHASQNAKCWASTHFTPAQDVTKVFDQSLAAKVRGRPYVPMSTSKLFPDHIYAPTSLDFPLVLTTTPTQADVPSIPLEVFARDVDKMLDQTATLTAHGAVLLRGLPLKTASDFDDFVHALGWPIVMLGGTGSERTQVTESVMTAFDDNLKGHTIEPCMSMAHSPKFPMNIAYFCEEAAENVEGGEMVLTNMRAVMKDLEAEGVPDLFESHGGVLYSKLLWSEANREDFTWQKRYFAETKAEVEAQLSDGVGNHEVNSWEWQEDDTLVCHTILPATLVHPCTGERMWFNGVHTNHRSYYDSAPHIDTSRGMPMDTSFADGTRLPDELVEKVRATMWKHSLAIPLEAGDVVIVDNIICGHGHMSYTKGVARKLLLAHFSDS